MHMSQMLVRRPFGMRSRQTIYTEQDEPPLRSGNRKDRKKILIEIVIPIQLAMWIAKMARWITDAQEAEAEEDEENDKEDVPVVPNPPQVAAHSSRVPICEDSQGVPPC
ncbi:hypothetical protein C8R44DRAFT_745323 [Mycena epipterygia]|nr:hypothetical protein C8R44DRAFT_745323 [Mycena epipterygia]